VEYTIIFFEIAQKYTKSTGSNTSRDGRVGVENNDTHTNKGNQKGVAVQRRFDGEKKETPAVSPAGASCYLW